jgi:hypothetical protein
MNLNLSKEDTATATTFAPVSHRIHDPSFKTQPRQNTKQVISLYGELLKNNDLTLRPTYQRQLCWLMEQKSNMIDSIMNGCPLPNFLLYMFDDVNECIDGQNRLAALKQYIEQDGSHDDYFPWIINYNTEDSSSAETSYKEHVFYKATPSFDKLILDHQQPRRKRRLGEPKVIRYMTPDEIRRFHQFDVSLQTINTFLTIEQRRDIFNKWQNGSAITGCDLFKNQDYPFCTLILEHQLERLFATRIGALLKTETNNWLWDLYRLLLTTMTNEGTIRFCALGTCALEKKIISNPPKEYQFTTEQYLVAVEKLDAFLEKMTAFPSFQKQTRLSLLLSCAFLYFNTTNSDHTRLMEIPQFQKEWMTRLLENETLKTKKANNTLNSFPNICCLIDSFPTIQTVTDDLLRVFVPPLALLTTTTTAVTPVTPAATFFSSYKKKPIPEALKRMVWNSRVGEHVGLRTCFCCEAVQISQRDFECAHITPESKDGETKLANLVPTCSKCNKSCASKCLREFKKLICPNPSVFF